MAQTIGSLDLNAFSDLYSDSTQYFWFESDSTATYGAGVHVTLVPDTSFISNPTGQNILMSTDGFSIRNGLLPMMVLDNDSLDFNFVDTTAGTYTTMATFGLSGMRIYSRDSGNNLVQLANIGYGEGAAQTGTDIAPYYTFGTRASGSTIGNYSMAEGGRTTASGRCSHAEGGVTTASGHNSHAEGTLTTASGQESHAEGRETTAGGWCSHAEGFGTTASESYAHAEGDSTTASGNRSHAEGWETTASEDESHAEGFRTTASGDQSHAEGDSTTASGRGAHAEGYDTMASGYYSHAEGYFTTASGRGAHAEGFFTIASGTNSHAQNTFTVATENNQTVIGKCNAATVSGSGTESDPYVYTDVGDYAFIIGNGTANTTAARSNAFTVDWNGNMWAENYYPVGSVYIGSTNTNPADILGFGTWELIRKSFAYQWVSSGATWNSTNTQSQAFVAILCGNTVELRLSWQNKVALSDGTVDIATIPLSVVGLESTGHQVFGVVSCDGLNAVGLAQLDWDPTNLKWTLRTYDWVTRTTSYPTGTGQGCNATFIFNVSPTSLIDSFCDEFHWRRKA